MRVDPSRAGALIAATAVMTAAAPAWAQTPPFAGTMAPSLSVSSGDVTEGGYRAPWPDASPVRLGTTGFPFGALPTPATEQEGRGWSVTPSLGLQVMGTDNLYQTRRNRRSELITTLSPGLLITADTTRLQGLINYQPSLELYAKDGSQTGIDHHFNGQMLATLVPETFFLDLRGSASTQAARGGYAPSGSGVVDRESEVQTSSFQISPYLMHRFGGLATAQIGYALQHVSQESGSNSAALLAPNGQRYFSDQKFTAHEIYGVVRSGEDLGRLALEARANATEYDGTGVLNNAYRRIAALEARYAITRFISVLGEFGYEQQRYSGLPPFEVSEPVWSTGAKFTFSDESSITARYGHHDGFDSARVDAAMRLGGRTRLFADYAETLTTGAQRAVDLLNTTSLDALGNPVDTATGAPVFQPFSNSLLGVQSSLMRVRTASASISQEWSRDIFTLRLSRERQTPVSSELGTVAERTSGTSGIFSWSHELTPGTSAIGSLQYGTFRTPGRGSGDVYTIGATLVTQLRPKLAGMLQFVTSSRSDDTASGRAIQNTIIAGLRQTF
jgi:uncharacterized protein (PEP-CTERM system associated)